MPGMVRREAAAVGVGRARAVERRAAAGDEGTAFAALAEAEVLEREQHGDRERVVDHAQVDVAVADAGHRHRHRARLRRGDVEQRPRRRCRCAAPLRRRRARTAGFLARSRARSADVTTSAPPPSEIMQQSSRWSGDEITREASTSSTVIGSWILGRRVQRRVAARGDRDLGELLGGRAVLVHVALRDHARSCRRWSGRRAPRRRRAGRRTRPPPVPIAKRSDAAVDP